MNSIFYLKFFGITFIVTFLILFLIFDTMADVRKLKEQANKSKNEMSQLITSCESKGGALLKTASGYQCFKLERITN